MDPGFLHKLEEKVLYLGCQGGEDRQHPHPGGRWDCGHGKEKASAFCSHAQTTGKGIPHPHRIRQMEGETADG